MRPHHIIHVSGIIALLTVISSAVLAYAYPSVEVASAAPTVTEQPTNVAPVMVDEPEPIAEVQVAIVPAPTKLGLPMADALDRVTKKTFGMEIHPETSPVPNDRFHGFHVGVDFETFDEEKDTDMPVLAVCDGPLLTKGLAKGYGGYALQACELDGEPVTVVYGHMDVKSIPAEPKSTWTRGQTIGVLGEGYSEETDGVRKHLHLGVHRGTEIDIHGYVRAATQTSAWLDVLPYLNH